jgi:tetratricopeptide (TPR) repeat protein
VLAVAGWIDALTGADTLGARADELLALATEHGFTAYITVATAHRGWALTAGGDPEGGRAEILECLAKARKFGAVSTTPLGLTWLARSEAALGRHAAGRDCLAQAFAIIERTGERINEAEARWVEGDLLAALGDAEAAETSYRRALDLARRQGAKLLELLAATALARFLAETSRRREALDLLRPLVDGFAAGADAPSVAAARRLADALA